MVQANIFAVTIIPTGIFYITRSSSINRFAIVIRNIKTTVPVTRVTIKRIVTTAKFRSYPMAISRPYVRSHLLTIVFFLQLGQQFIPIFSLMLQLLVQVFVLLHQYGSFRNFHCRRTAHTQKSFFRSSFFFQRNTVFIHLLAYILLDGCKSCHILLHSFRNFGKLLQFCFLCCMVCSKSSQLSLVGHAFKNNTVHNQQASNKSKSTTANYTSIFFDIFFFIGFPFKFPTVIRYKDKGVGTVFIPELTESFTVI